MPRKRPRHFARQGPPRCRYLGVASFELTLILELVKIFRVEKSGKKPAAVNSEFENLTQDWLGGRRHPRAGWG